MLAGQEHALIFIHGAGSNADFWHEQRAAFPAAHYLNLPGHADARTRTAQQPGSDTVEGYADWVARYVEERALRSVVLNGHSMGGAITLTLALRRPEWLHAIVLTGSGARLKVLPRLLELLRTDYPAAVDFIVEHSFAPRTEELTYAQKARLTGTRRQLLRTPQAVTRGDYEACDRFDVMPRTAEITLPTLCIVGEQDTMTPPRYSEYVATHVPGSRMVTIPDAGHMLPLEQPVEYNRVLREFLDFGF